MHEAPGPQGRFDFGFGLLSWSDQAGFHVEAELAHTRDLRIYIGATSSGVSCGIVLKSAKHGSSPMASTAVTRRGSDGSRDARGLLEWR